MTDAEYEAKLKRVIEAAQTASYNMGIQAAIAIVDLNIKDGDEKEFLLGLLQEAKAKSPKGEE